jgi:murein DD-endopeptidase MepM/ murein hydrolase activator NlpD
VFLVVTLGAACERAGDPARGGGRDIALQRDADTIEARVPRDATLESLFRQNNLSADLTAALVDALRDVFNPRDLRANQSYWLTRSLEGLFREFRYEIDTDRRLRVVMTSAPDGTPPAFDATVVTLPKQIELAAIVAVIGREHPSLVGSLEAQGQNIQLALELAEIFGGEVDFNSDLQNGDRIEVLFERATREGEFIGYGDIKAAVLENEGRRITAIRFAGADGKPGWHDEQGRSLKRQFLQSPLPFEPRVTSRFSYRRLHPVHGTTRAHLGVDYGAPSGTPVRAVASGTVEVAGWSGEAGRMVRIRHPGGYQTAYLHLSSFAPGIRPGVRVDQAQLIGRVGDSGTATGPHLDYRIIKNGAYVNPLVELKRMPKGEPIAPEARAGFERTRDEALGELQTRLAAGPSAKPVAPTAPSGK